MKIELDRIYNMDCLEGMKLIPDGTINLTVTSPPYNVGLFYNEYNDNKEYSDYLAWMKDVFSENYRVLATDGRMCINIGDGKNGSIPTHSDFIQICKSIGFYVMSIIVWNKNTTSNRTAWGSFMSPSCPSFPRCFEYVLIFSKSKKLTHKGDTTILKDNFIKWTNGMWTFVPETKQRWHPAVYPLELPTRCIELLTYKGDVVLDPFMGSGTTAIACIKEKRHFVGFELNKEYYDRAVKRIKDEQAQLTLF